MIKFNELQPGDYVYAQYEGELWEGIVNDLNNEDKEVCVQTEVQEFWFRPEDLRPIPLSENELFKFNFEKESNGDGRIKYKKGPFRIQLPAEGGFSDFEIWYREDRRHIKQPIHVHQLQNHYYQMTKVELGRN
ncbi:hypothetical protein [Flavihumibacter solisilvae]|jgi:hypothetical protein|uniref:Uncharacterized protein n=1 Tax=Flavihumibacter solisilvae TaxID=1349421 RepID=A0A0C1L183_9BACT|nr:hypothetical protein [Flavihumibacter solisilvae]KIC93391.1 hypothetical protein OI18_16545 [Flavihumibacter solisilvae]